MTREEAIKDLHHLILKLKQADGDDRVYEHYKEAIEALQTEQNIYKEGYKSCKRIMAREKQFNSYCPKCMGKLEPCEDAISRAEAMNVLDSLYLDGESAQGFTADANEDCLIGKYKAIEILEELPSVTPQTEPSKIKCNSDTIKQLRDMVADINCEEIFAHDDVTMPMWTSAWRERMFDLIDELPSVQPEPKIGRWEYVQYDGNPKIGNWHCSECNRIVCGVIRAGNPVYAYKYCPECGAKMEDGE